MEIIIKKEKTKMEKVKLSKLKDYELCQYTKNLEENVGHLYRSKRTKLLNKAYKEMFNRWKGLLGYKN
jgi:hypothetical protein